MSRRDSAPIAYALRSHLALATLTCTHVELRPCMPRNIRTPLFPSATIAAAQVTGRPRPHSRVTKRVRTYNHLLGGRHGAFASKRGQIFREQDLPGAGYRP